MNPGECKSLSICKYGAVKSTQPFVIGHGETLATRDRTTDKHLKVQVGTQPTILFHNAGELGR